MKTKKPKAHAETLTGITTSAPRRIVTRTGKPMAVITMEVESSKRSSYPLRVVGFDLMALELLIHQRGERLTITGPYTWNNGYQLIARTLVKNT